MSQPASRLITLIMLLQRRPGQKAANVALSNRAPWEKVENQPDGSVVVLFTAPDLTWAASSVLVYGPLVTVEEPEELRTMVAEWARAIEEKY